MRRAAHQILDRPPVFLDPLATRIAGDKLRNQSEQHDAARGLRAFVAARSRYAEDELAHSVSLGIRQYVVLGAGLDTFAYRNPFAPSLRVFEVDHPDTQLWKKDRLQTAGIDIPASVTFVPVNFETQSLRTELHAAPNFDPFQPAFFSMLGVVPYLSQEALQTTLSFVASMPAASAIVFDYAVPPGTLDLADRQRFQFLASRVARIGESFRLFLEPQTLAALLISSGFKHYEDLGANEINSRYFTNRQDGLCVASSLGRFLGARS
jgi:methyltransferase (TIGR00027 family)